MIGHFLHLISSALTLTLTGQGLFFINNGRAFVLKQRKEINQRQDLIFSDPYYEQFSPQRGRRNMMREQ